MARSAPIAGWSVWMNMPRMSGLAVSMSWVNLNVSSAV
jgi:hypothetical protein